MALLHRSLLSVLLLILPGCTLLVSTDDECSTDRDCLSMGLGLSCVEGLCVALPGAFDPDARSEPQQETEPQAEVEPEPSSDSDVADGADTDVVGRSPDADVAVDIERSETEADATIDTDPEAEPSSDTDVVGRSPDADVTVDIELSEAEAEATVDTGPEPGPEPQPEPEPEPEPEPDVLLDVQPDVSDAPDAPDASEVPDVPDVPDVPPTNPGHVSFTLFDSPKIYLAPAVEAAPLVDIGAELDKLSPEYTPGEDRLPMLSRNGEWMVLNGERFDPDCNGWGCMILVRTDFSEGDAVRVGGVPIHQYESAAVADDASFIVYSDTVDGTPNYADLLVVHKVGDFWDTPVMLTSESPWTYNLLPALNPSHDRVAFACADAPYEAVGTAICLVELDGSGFQTLKTPADAPPGFTGEGTLYHPSWESDSVLVVTGEWSSASHLWRIDVDTGEMSIVTYAFDEDYAPCVLPNGRIASMWWGSPGFDNVIKVMDADGTNGEIVYSGELIYQGTLGCGE